MPAATPKRLTRSREDRIVAGVCSGAARYFDVDPVIPRVVLAVLAVFGGAGIAIYAFAWLLIPEDGSPSTRLERWLEGKRGDRSRDILIVIVALIGLSFLIGSDPFAHRISGAALVVVLVMTVAALVGRRRAGHEPPPPPQYGPAPDPFGPAAPGVADAPTQMWSPPATTRRPRSWLGWLTIGMTLLVAGAFSTVAVAGWAHPQPADVLAACVGVLAVGLLVGAVFGRAWSLIPVGVLLVGLLAVANALPRNLTWSAGNRTWTPVATVAPAYVLGAGDAQIDLTQLPAHEPASFSSRIGAGRLVVIVPANTSLTIHATTSAGRIEVFGHEQDGTSVDLHQSVPATSRDPRVVTLDLQMGFGDVEVRHAAA
jgi:phage shock protein PspC (stress-responsive transcriptional regulator)